MDINEIDDQHYGMETNTQSEADFFLKQLKPHHIVLEWGAGASSASIAKRVKKLYSIEHNQGFVEIIKNTFPENAELFFVPPNEEEGQGEDGSYQQYENYINKATHISIENKVKFDVILIDGRARVECAKNCINIAHENTLIFIHDYNHPDQKYTRKEYFEAEKYLKRIEGDHTMWMFKIMK